MLILGIETSCDETAAALVEDGRHVLSSVVSSQDEIHSAYGGVVPELASRAHIQAIVPVMDRALEQAGVTFKDLHGLAVTQGPGLVGSLLVGICTAKSIAAVTRLPIAGVNHLEAHVIVNFLSDDPPSFPFTALVVSGGHTNLYLVKDFLKFELLGQTRDDAAGEAFDKTAKFLGLGYPGGVIIDRMAGQGDPDAIAFPRAMMDTDNLDFSFSGLKTAVITYLKKHPLDGPDVDRRTANLVASFQEAVVDVLVSKSLRAAEMNRTGSLVLAGGVAANSRLRQKIEIGAREAGIRLFVPEAKLCTDNATGVAAMGFHLLTRGVRSDMDMDAYSRLPSRDNAVHL